MWTHDLRALACTLHQRPPATAASCIALGDRVRRVATAARSSGVADVADLLDEAADWFRGWADYTPYPPMDADTRNNMAQALLLAAGTGERVSNVVQLKTRGVAARGAA